jgi:hypothetical protein
VYILFNFVDIQINKNKLMIVWNKKKLKKDSIQKGEIEPKNCIILFELRLYLIKF